MNFSERLHDNPEAQNMEMKKELSESVRNKINFLRSEAFNPDDNFQRASRRREATLMAESMINDVLSNSPTFGSWIMKRGQKLGWQVCYDVAMSVCKEEKFTLEEVKRILDETPEPNAEYYQMNIPEPDEV